MLGTGDGNKSDFVVPPRQGRVATNSAERSVNMLSDKKILNTGITCQSGRPAARRWPATPNGG